MPPHQSETALIRQLAWQLNFAATDCILSSVLIPFRRRIRAAGQPAGISRSAEWSKTYLRRLLVLLAIGLVHAVLLAPGEVLRYYAILGAPLLLVRRLPSWLLAVGLALCLLLALKLDWVTSLPRRIPIVAAWTAPNGDAVRASGQNLERAEKQSLDASYGKLVRLRAELLWDGVRHFRPIPMYPIIFSMFLLGLLTSRRGLLVHPLAHLALLRSAAAAGSVLGSSGQCSLRVGAAAQGPKRPRDPVPGAGLQGSFRAGWQPGIGPVLWVCGDVDVVSRKRTAGVRRLMPIGQVGRMAPTNFLMQSLVMLLLMGRVEVWAWHSNRAWRHSCH